MDEKTAKTFQAVGNWARTEQMELRANFGKDYTLLGLYQQRTELYNEGRAFHSVTGPASSDPRELTNKLVSGLAKVRRRGGILVPDFTQEAVVTQWQAVAERPDSPEL